MKEVKYNSESTLHIKEPREAKSAFLSEVYINNWNSYYIVSSSLIGIFLLGVAIKGVARGKGDPPETEKML